MMIMTSHVQISVTKMKVTAINTTLMKLLMMRHCSHNNSNDDNNDDNNDYMTSS